MNDSMGRFLVDVKWSGITTLYVVTIPRFPVENVVLFCFRLIVRSCCLRPAPWNIRSENGSTY